MARKIRHSKGSLQEQAELKEPSSIYEVVKDNNVLLEHIEAIV
jgi:hypothetical protein